MSWDLYLLGALVDTFVHAIFDVAWFKLVLVSWPFSLSRVDMRRTKHGTSMCNIPCKASLSMDITCRTWRHHWVYHNICTWSYPEASVRTDYSVLFVLFVWIAIAQTLNLQHIVIQLA